MLVKKMLLAIVLSVVFGGLIFCPKTFASVVTSSAVAVQENKEDGKDVEHDGIEAITEEKAETVENIDMVDVVLLFSGGISSGIVFATLMFVLSLLVNLFFDVVNK